MHPSRLLVLDEPTNGLDPLIQQEFYRLVEEEAAGGGTVFLSSHVLSEVERACQRVGILRQGRLVQVARLDELHHLRYHRLEADFSGEVPVEAVRALAGVEDVTVEDHHLSCAVRGGFGPLLEVLGRGQITQPGDPRAHPGGGVPRLLPRPGELRPWHPRERPDDRGPGSLQLTPAPWPAAGPGTAW